MQTTKVLVRHAQYRWTQRSSAVHNGRGLVKKLANGAPLFSAIVAPLATLYAIPALSMNWYSLDSISVPDPAASSVLSAITLAFELAGNILLFFRFSKNHKLRKRAAPTSTICYCLTTVLGVVNMSIFGAYRRDTSGYEYRDGFFCSVFSTMLSGLIALSLIYQLAYSVIVPKEEDDHTGANSVETRLQARHFLITEGIFFATLALESLLLSRIEETWSFFDAVYFSVVIATTCGFGADFAPRKAASRVLLFPFAIITISGLAVMISTIAKYTASSPETRKQRWKAIYEQRTEKEKQNGKPADELIAEVKFLEKANRQEKSLSRLYDLLLSMVGFAIFWGIGALCFTAVEPWTYGEALYFGYIFFLTIGLGDFYPSTPASRVFFVFYAFVAIPTVASFFLQAFSQVIEAMTDKRMEKEKARKGLKPKVAKNTSIGTHHEKGDPDQADENAQDHEDEFRPFVSHAELVERYHKQFSQKGIELSSRKLKDAIKDEDRDGKQEERVCSGGDESTEDDTQASEGDAPSEDKTVAAREETDPIEKNTDEVLAKGAKAAIKGDEGNPDLTSDDHPDFAKAMLDELLLHSLHLETIARKMIISKLPPGSQVRLVLQADKHLMQRAIHSHEEGQDDGSDSEIDCRLSGKKESDLEQMHMYRESFARMLVSATKLKRLLGKEQLIFERRRGPIYQNGQPVPPDQ